MRRPLLTLGLICASLFTLWAPRSALGQLKLPLTLKILYTTAYDDNILKYSGRDLSRFESNTEAFPSEITTTDDWVNTLGWRLYRDFSLGRRFKFRPYYSGRISVYAVNALKNSQSHSFLGRLAYRNQAFLSLKYFYLPDFYLRVYKDRDLNEYQSASFDLARPAASLRFRYQVYELESEFGKEFTYYNAYFTEFDSEAQFWSFTGTYYGVPNLEMALGYGFKTSDNVGFNQEAQSGGLSSLGEDTEYGDATYEEDQCSFTASYQIPLESTWDWKISLSLQRNWRYYQSQQAFSQDPFHVGRRDRRDVIEPALSVSPYSELTAEFRFTYDLRRTSSPDPLVSDVKNFDQRSIEITLIYQIF